MALSSKATYREGSLLINQLIVTKENEIRTLNECIELLRAIITPTGRNNSEAQSNSNDGARSSSTYHFSTSLQQDEDELVKVMAALRRGNASDENSHDLSEQESSLLVQKQWLCYYRITKKRIIHNIIGKCELIRDFLIQGGQTSTGTNTNSDTKDKESINTLVSLVELFTRVEAEEGLVQHLETTDTADTNLPGTASKTDKFHVLDYDNIETSKKLLNSYLKEIVDC